jgi:RNA polymerase sigma factor (sigma-70 family)
VTTNQSNRLIDYLRRTVVHDAAGTTDGQLLGKFLDAKDGAAFAALVRRHAPMVWGVCSRMLSSQDDAEDAFQASFLVLVRKGAALPDKEMVGNWLYGVAYQTAVRMRALAAKRRDRERQMAIMPEPTSADQYVWNDLQPILDEELARLPDKYRTVIVLCYLEDKTRKVVARQLGIPEGTVASRLAVARTLLARRLTRRGIVVSAVLLEAVLSSHAASAGVPMALVSSTIKVAALVAAGQAVTTVISPTVAALFSGVTKAMFVTKIKSVLAVVLVIAALAGTVGVIFQTQAAEQPTTKADVLVAKKDLDMSDEKQVRANPPAQPKQQPAKTDQERMVGSWFITNEDSKRKGEIWVISKDRILMGANRLGGIANLHFHRLDAGKSPKQIDITVTLVKGRVIGIIKGVYILEGDKLQLCLAAMNEDRPTVFPRTPGAGEVVILQRRTPGGEQSRAKAEQPAKSDQERMVGNWFITNDDSLRKGEMWVITKDSILMHAKNLGVNVQQYFHRVDASKTPKQIDITVRKVNGPPIAVMKGIYELDGDELRLCLGVGKDRPMAFPKQPAPGAVLILQRQAPGGERPKAKEEQPAKSDLERMAGLWTIVNDDSKRKGEVWDIGTHQIVKNPFLTGIITQSYFHRLDPAKSPKQIDITVTTASNKIGTEFPIDGAKNRILGVIKGIYELDRGEFRLCLGDMGKDRPAAFPVKPKQGEVLILHRGVEPKVNDSALAKAEKLRVLIDKVLAAHGAEDKLKKLQFTMTVRHSNGYINQFFVQPPKNFRWETTFPNQTAKWIVIHFPGTRRWWTKEPNEEAKGFILTGLEPPMENWHDLVKFFGPRQVLRLKDADHKVALLDEEAKIGDRAAVGVQITGPRFTWKMYFDKETHLLLKGFGSDINREVTFSDYKKFDGIPIAQKEHDGHFEPVVTDFKVVDEFDPKLFEDPNLSFQPNVKNADKLRELIDKVLAAHGGEDRLNKLQFTMTVKHSNGETQHYFVQPPKNFRWETTHGDRTVKRIVILFPEGRRLWTKEPNEEAKETFLSGVFGAELPVGYWHDYVKFFGPRQVLRLKDADHRVALLDEEARIGDRAAVGVEVTGPRGNRKMYFDKETHLLLKTQSVTWLGRGAPPKQLTDSKHPFVSRNAFSFSDYKKFDGIPIAQKEHDGHFEPIVTDFKVVDEFDPKLFENPNLSYQPKAKKGAPAKDRNPAQPKVLTPDDGVTS